MRHRVTLTRVQTIIDRRCVMCHNLTLSSNSLLMLGRFDSAASTFRESSIGQRFEFDDKDPTGMATRSGLFALPEESRKSMRRWIFGGMAILMLGGIAFGFWPYVWAVHRMNGFCEALATGTPMGDVQAQAAERGYEVSSAAEGQIRVQDSRLGGRRICAVQFDAQGLQSSKVTDPP